VKGGPVHVVFGVLLVRQQRLYFSAQIDVAAAGAVEKSRPLAGLDRQRVVIKGFNPL